jgi:uncharacterized protein
MVSPKERKEIRKAVDWYGHAAEGGNVVAQCNLATLYFRGSGVAQNYAQAAQWFRKAAESGYAAGQQSLAWMYFTGKGVPRPHEQRGATISVELMICG